MKAVIFDKDGVLVETFNLHFESYIKILSKIGVKIEKIDLIKSYGMKPPEIIKRMMEGKGRKITERLAKKLAEKKEEYYVKIAEKKLKLLPGVKKLLIYFKKKKYKIGLASSASKKGIEQLMKVTKIKKYFDATINGFEVKFSKPNPEIFLKCAKKLKVKPEECVVIEDSIHGIKAAKRANMKCIAVATGQHSKKELKKEKPDLLLDSLEEFNKILSFLDSSS